MYYSVLFFVIASLVKIYSTQEDFTALMSVMRDVDWKILMCTRCDKVEEIKKALEEVEACNNKIDKGIMDMQKDIRTKYASNPDECVKQQKEKNGAYIKGKDKAYVDQYTGCVKAFVAQKGKFDPNYDNCK